MVRPGGNHGAVLFAINELLELLFISSVVRPGRTRGVLENQVLRLSLLSGASAVVLIETFSSFGGMGAYYGVLLLAVSKLLRATGLLRDRIEKKEKLLRLSQIANRYGHRYVLWLADSWLT
jgi:hypothetical protein